MMKISLFPRRLFARFCSFAKCDKSQPEIGCIKMCSEFPLLENRAAGENLYFCFKNLETSEKIISTVLIIFKPQLSSGKSQSSLVCFGCPPGSILESCSENGPTEEFLSSQMISLFPKLWEFNMVQTEKLRY